MTDSYLKVLKADPRPWLLEEDNPSVRYFALTELMDKSLKHPSVKKAKRDIMKIGPVPTILFKQRDGGYWDNAEDFYVRAKYRGTVWQLIILANLGADIDDLQVRQAGEFILEWSQDRESGGFSYRGNGKGGLHTAVLPCLTGNMLYSLIRLGFFDDKRVQHGLKWIENYFRADDGESKPPAVWPYDRFEQCWGSHTCHMGLVKILKAISEIPEAKRTPGLRQVSAAGAEHLLKHHLYKSSHDVGNIAKPAWTKFSFPLMWNTDALEMLGILAMLGYREERMLDAIELVRSKQDDQGRWNLETTFNGRFQVNIERKGKASKWVTLNALRVLKSYYG
jgi:hypothetical protein